MPNVLFTNVETLKVVIEFFANDSQMLHLFISSILEDSQIKCLVSFFPTLIILYQLVTKNPNSQQAIECIKKLFRQMNMYSRLIGYSVISDINSVRWTTV